MISHCISNIRSNFARLNAQIVEKQKEQEFEGSISIIDRTILVSLTIYQISYDYE